MIAALGIKPDKQEQRFDFAFKAKMGEEEWELSMSSVLSQDGKTIWVMAWLDPLPESAAAVPRNALLRLLAENDHIGNGKFFAYIPSNRRFVMQKVVPNENMTSAKYKVMLQDLGTSVVETYPIWAVKNWSETPAGTAASPPPRRRKAPAPRPAAGDRAADNARPKSTGAPVAAGRAIGNNREHGASTNSGFFGCAARYLYSLESVIRSRRSRSVRPRRPRGAERIEHGEDVDHLLSDRTGDRRQVAERRQQHAGDAQHHPADGDSAAQSAASGADVQQFVDARQLVVHQDRAGSLRGHFASLPHRQSHGRGDHGRRVIDAVADVDRVVVGGFLCERSPVSLPDSCRHTLR